MNLSDAYRYFRKDRTFFFAHEAIRRAREAVAKHEAARAHYETCAALKDSDECLTRLYNTQGKPLDTFNLSPGYEPVAVSRC